MRWFKPNLRSSLFALLFGAPGEPTTVIQTYTIEDIRERMQSMAVAAGNGPRAQQVLRRIRYAGDVEGLWFIRSELMALLADAYGELEALDKIDAVSEMFDDLLPEGLRSRPSPLGASIRDTGRSDF